MSRSREALEKAIIAKAMKEPEFLAQLLRDPMGFIKSLAGSALAPSLSLQRARALGDPDPYLSASTRKWHC